MISMHVSVQHTSLPVSIVYCKVLLHNDLLGCNFIVILARPTMPCIHVVIIQVAS